MSQSFRFKRSCQSWTLWATNFSAAISRSRAVDSGFAATAEIQKPMKRKEATPKCMAVAGLLLTMYFGSYHPNCARIHFFGLDFTHGPRGVKCLRNHRGTKPLVT